MDRRRFLRTVAVVGGGAAVARALAADRDAPERRPSAARGKKSETARVALVRAADRAEGVRRAIELLELPAPKGKSLFLKPNCNSADAFPGSTHAETLAALVRSLLAAGAGRLTVGDRSGMGETRRVMQRKGILEMARELRFETVVFDELGADGWVAKQVPGGHWKRGFALAAPALSADGIVQTCCLKTHRFGGHFTLSLKNSVGLAAKVVPGEPYDYMAELHGSPHQRLMIAEINAAYRPDLVLLDAMEGFADGGPDTGRRIAPGVILAGADRVAVDAVGVAMLRHHGTTAAVSRGRVFEQEQIARAAELGIGISSPEKIEIVAADATSAEYARAIRDQLLA